MMSFRLKQLKDFLNAAHLISLEVFCFMVAIEYLFSRDSQQ